MRPAVVYAICILGVVIMGSLIGISTLPGAWYDSLVKPSFTPPNWVFGPVWTVLYALIGWVGARKWLFGGERGLWFSQLALNFLWSPVFFGLNLAVTALVIIATLWLLIATFIAKEWRKDRLSAQLFLPYLAWVSLAAALNAGIVALN